MSSQHTSPSEPRLKSQTPNPALIEDLIADFLQEEQTAREVAQSGKAPGPSTGWKDFDHEIGGFLAPGVHTVLAAPGAGKTALCLQIASRCGFPALYVSAEMRRIELLRRLIARETRQYLGKLRGGQVSANELKQWARSTAQCVPQLALFDAQEAAGASGGNGATVAAIAARALALRERYESEHLLIVIDSVTEWGPLSTLDTKGPALNEYATAEGAVNGLKNLSSTLDCPVIAIAHRHRAGQGKDADKLHAAKGTGRYEYISETIWDLERKGPSDRDNCVNVELKLLKNRYGPVGMCFNMEFEGRIQNFVMKK